MSKNQPQQPVVKDSKGCIRFQSNPLVEALLNHGARTGFGLNQLACIQADPADRMQFAQLIGYSLGGYADLSFTTDESVRIASNSFTGPDEFNQEAAAKKLAEVTEYPWVHMPEEGKRRMRADAKAIFNAGLKARS